MCSIAIKIPDEVLYDTKMTKDEANAFAKKATALMLYLKNHISIGYCAQIARTLISSRPHGMYASASAFIFCGR